MNVQGYDLPDDLYYTRDHAWVKVEGDHIRVGITDVMQRLAGEISFIRVPRAGKRFEEGKTLASVQSGKWAGKIMTPMVGTVVEANTELASNPGLLNSSPYEEGWIAVMEPDDLASGLDALMRGADVEPWITKELASMAGRLPSSDVVADVGRRLVREVRGSKADRWLGQCGVHRDNWSADTANVRLIRTTSAASTRAMLRRYLE